MDIKQGSFAKKEVYIFTILSFVLIFVFSLAYAFIHNITIYYYDAGYYWETADPVFKNGFNLLNFPETLRGYFLPVLISFFKYKFHTVFAWRLLSSLFAASCFSISLPYFLLGRLIKSVKELLRTLLSYFFFMYIWGNFMQYPLSDFAAAFFMFSGVSILKNQRGKNGYAKIILLILGGMFLYAAYNTRVAYLYGILVSIVILICINFQNIKNMLFKLFCVLIGMSVIALPQCLINKQYVGSFSPKVYTEQAYGYSRSLQLQQVFWGLSYSRFEGYLPNTNNTASHYYPEMEVIFNDSVGNEIINRENLEEETFSLSDFFLTFLKYPFDMLSLYMRHLVSLLTPAYRKVYNDDLYVEKGFYASVSIIIWLIAGISLLTLKNRHENNNEKWYYLALILPCLLQLFGAPEIRFFLPVYLLGYYYVFAVVDYKELIASLKGKWLQVSICSLIVFMLWMTVYGDVLAANKHDVFMIDNGEWYASIRSVIKNILY